LYGIAEFPEFKFPYTGQDLNGDHGILCGGNSGLGHFIGNLGKGIKGDANPGNEDPIK
jgi:hypothetical protein